MVKLDKIEEKKESFLLGRSWKIHSGKSKLEVYYKSHTYAAIKHVISVEMYMS